MENRAGDYPPGELPVASCLFSGGGVDLRTSRAGVVWGGEGMKWFQSSAREIDMS